MIDHFVEGTDSVGKYGYRFYTFSVHRARAKEAPLPLGELLGESTVAQGTDAFRRDGVVALYGVLNGLKDKRVDEKNKHVTVTSVEPVGRSIRFKVDLGTSGTNSTFTDPAAMNGSPVFMRAERHIESNERRALIVAGSKSTVGLLALESQSGATGTSQLIPLLKRSFRAHTQLVIDFDAVVHEEALRAFLDQAHIGAVTLRRSGLPSDIADQLEVPAKDAPFGRLEMKISKGRIPELTRTLTEKFRTNSQARQRLLSVGDLAFDELNVKMEVGGRSTTLSIAAERMPSFVYELRGRDRVDDEDFYAQVNGMVHEVAGAFGALVGADWQTGDWSEESRKTALELPTQEAPDGPEVDES
ncbi:hypothetical protein [Amycolatopsis sp. FDAARGOS 1241]|uniref:hypothetical protein n=1 Tax=Amycolatopsis sp. FDAARGOS 1241 TaxID=2778070 RepID=UPI001950AFDA|nr:hypothetical protein [Amycolatopsis sp. FDAARGOS 1241]QRP45771.1 hypothetical protein I6J71_42930 [Amycolatopsis sp. FDAARGOS 1241]